MPNALAVTRTVLSKQSVEFSFADGVKLTFIPQYLFGIAMFGIEKVKIQQNNNLVFEYNGRGSDPPLTILFMEQGWTQPRVAKYVYEALRYADEHADTPEFSGYNNLFSRIVELPDKLEENACKLLTR